MYIYHFFRDFSYSTYVRKLHFFVVVEHLESLYYGNTDTVALYSPHFLIFGVQRGKKSHDCNNEVILHLMDFLIHDFAFSIQCQKLANMSWHHCSKRISIRPNFNHVCSMKIQNCAFARMFLSNFVSFWLIAYFQIVFLLKIQNGFTLQHII